MQRINIPWLGVPVELFTAPLDATSQSLLNLELEFALLVRGSSDGQVRRVLVDTRGRVWGCKDGRCGGTRGSRDDMMVLRRCVPDC